MNHANSPSSSLSKETIITEFFAGVYRWMTLAMLITGVVAWYAAGSELFINFLNSYEYAFMGLIIAELALVFLLIAKIQTMSRSVAGATFIGYSILSGLTFSSIFMVYTDATIFKAFAVAAMMFGAMSVYGYTTKRDLSAWGSFLFMSLIGIILGSLLNFFLESPMIEWVITYGGIIIFAGLTAYDHQRLKAWALMDVDGSKNLVIHGALRLYLDFINLFLMLLRVFNRD